LGNRKQDPTKGTTHSVEGRKLNDEKGGVGEVHTKKEKKTGRTGPSTEPKKKLFSCTKNWVDEGGGKSKWDCEWGQKKRSRESSSTGAEEGHLANSTEGGEGANRE